MTKFVRRLQRIGSSILVSLPKEWVDANNLDKSSQVELETGQDSISISANKEIRPTKELVISYPLPKEENIVADITGAYLLGYDITSSFVGRVSLFAEIEILSWPVSIST